MKRTGVYIIALLISATVFGQSGKKFVREGNRDFNEKKYEESEVSYRKALNNEADLFDAVFNLGDALYKQEKFDEAANEFNGLASRAESNKKLAKTYHNLGNSLLKSQKIEESIEAYKQSLRYYPDDQETKYNLSYAKDLLKQQQKKDQEKKQDQKQNKDQDKNKDKQEQDKENQDQKEKDQQEQNKNEQQKDKQEQQKQPQKISKEDANRLLNALANDEKKVQEKVKKAKAKMQKVKTEKDW